MTYKEDSPMTREQIQQYVRLMRYETLTDELLVLYINSGSFRYIGIRGLYSIGLRVGRLTNRELQELGIEISNLKEYTENYLHRMLEDYIQENLQEGMDTFENVSSQEKEKVRFGYDTYSSLVTNLIAGNDEYNQEERLDKMIKEYEKIGNKYFELAGKYNITPNQYYLNWLKEDISGLEGIKGHL